MKTVPHPQESFHMSFENEVGCSLSSVTWHLYLIYQFSSLINRIPNCYFIRIIWIYCGSFFLTAPLKSLFDITLSSELKANLCFLSFSLPASVHLGRCGLDFQLETELAWYCWHTFSAHHMCDEYLAWTVSKISLLAYTCGGHFLPFLRTTGWFPSSWGYF